MVKEIKIFDIPFCDEPEELFKLRLEAKISVAQLWHHIKAKGIVWHKLTRKQGIAELIKAEREMLDTAELLR